MRSHGGRRAARDRAYEERADASAEKTRPRSRSVLILDDEPMVRMMWLRVAEPLDVEVIAVATIDQARAVLAVDPVDCVVCDWNLGRVDTSQALVVDLLRDGVPLVVTSGDARALERLGPTCPTLAKPFSLADVEGVLLGTWRPSTPSPAPSRPRAR